MIIKNNLSTTPVKNYALYFLGCVALLFIVVGFTAWNLNSLLHSTDDISQLQASIAEQQRQLAEHQRKSDDLSAKINAIKTPQFVQEVKFMNNAIKRRIFSWSRLFDVFEQLLPGDVKMVSVLPDIDGERINLSIEVAGRGLEDIVELIRVLENSTAFTDVTLRQERESEDGLLHANISLRYLAETQPPAAAQVSAASATPKEEEEAE